MRHRVKLIVFLPVLLIAFNALGQGKGFHFKRNLATITTGGWYSLTVPRDAYASVSRDFSDFRIYQFNGADTLEIPFLLRVLDDVVNDEVVELPAFNKSKRGGKLFLTVELKRDQKVNHLDLEFEEANFNGYAQLEGSADQQTWFMVDSLERILSIQNSTIDFKATALDFPSTNYRYLRIGMQADKPLNLVSASFRKRETKSGTHLDAAVNYVATTQKKEKQTVLDVTLSQLQPVSSVVIDATSTLDFYRPVTIEALRDSTKTQRGWMYYYENLYSGYITSLNDNRFQFPYALGKKIRITISNADNPPLNFKSVSVSGPQVELVTKLEPGEHALFYGNPTAGAPSYDVVHFTNKIPANLTPAQLEAAVNLTYPLEKTSPLLESKLWLWAIMGVVIAVLGFFTLKMMKAKS